MSLAVIIKNFMREEPIKLLVESILKFLPEARIYIADDSGEISPKKQELYKSLEEKGHKIIYPPYNSGISVGRNMLVDIVKENYILQCDDDFLFNERPNIEAAIKMDADIVCGLLTHLDGRECHYEWDLEIKDRCIHKIKPTLPNIDLGLNFFLAKREVFDKVRWDNKLIVSTEHMDFFMSAKKAGLKIVYCPELKGIHYPQEQTDSYLVFRRRVFHWLHFADKWGVDTVEENGEITNYRTEAYKWVDQPSNERIYRDDDISVDTELDHLKEVTNTFLEYHIKESYSVTPYGLTNTLRVGYDHTMPLEELENNLGNKPITDNHELINFLKDKVSLGHRILLHGWTHTRITDYSPETIKSKIREAKEFLEKELNTKIEYFVPPFNHHNEITDKIANELGMHVLHNDGDALEALIKENQSCTHFYAWYHYWRLDKEELRKWLNAQ